MEPSPTRSTNRPPTDTHPPRPRRLSRLRLLLGYRRAENPHHSHGASLSPHSSDAPPQSHSSSSLTLHANNESQDTQSADIEQRLKNARETVLKALKLALDVAEKVNDIIPIHAVNAVIGGLQVPLERQDVWCTICFLAVSDHTADQCRQCRYTLTAPRPNRKPL